MEKNSCCVLFALNFKLDVYATEAFKACDTVEGCMLEAQCHDGEH
jgi:hypothetical protein